MAGLHRRMNLLAKQDEIQKLYRKFISVGNEIDGDEANRSERKDKYDWGELESFVTRPSKDVMSAGLLCLLYPCVIVSLMTHGVDTAES